MSPQTEIYWYAVFKCIPYEVDYEVSRRFETAAEAEACLEQMLCDSYPKDQHRHDCPDFGITAFEWWLSSEVDELEVKHCKEIGWLTSKNSPQKSIGKS